MEADRRKRIVDAYVALPHGGFKTSEAIQFVRKCGARSISHFLDIAKPSNIVRLERILDV